MSATTAPTKSPAKKAPVKKPSAESKLTGEQLIAKMDRALPGWKKYVEDREAKLPKDKRRNAKDYATFEHGYTELRSRGLKLKDARAKIAK